MRKFIFAIAILVFVTYSSCSILECTPAGNKADCNKVNPGDGAKCCWHEAEGATGFPICQGLTKEVLKEFSKYFDSFKKTHSGKKVSVDCSASYMKVALLGALLLLF